MTFINLNKQMMIVKKDNNNSKDQSKKKGSFKLNTEFNFNNTHSLALEVEGGPF